jgi:hypothetical protein
MGEVASIREIVHEQVWYPIVKETTASVLNHKVAQFAVALFVVISAASAYVYWRYANFSIDPATRRKFGEMISQVQASGSQTHTRTNQFSTLEEQMVDLSKSPIPKEVDFEVEEVV